MARGFILNSRAVLKFLNSTPRRWCGEPMALFVPWWGKRDDSDGHHVQFTGSFAGHALRGLHLNRNQTFLSIQQSLWNQCYIIETSTALGKSPTLTCLPEFRRIPFIAFMLYFVSHSRGTQRLEPIPPFGSSKVLKPRKSIQWLLLTQQK